MLVLETTKPPLGLYAPLEVACGGDREESAYDQPPRPHGLTCQSVHASGSNLRRSQPRPQWCHELKPPAGSFVAARAHCEKHYYQLDSSWLVRCTARMGDYSKCDASDLPLDCNPAPSLPPPAPPVWVEHADECTHLLRPPEVEATSSASFRIRPAFSAPPVPRCELGLKINVEWRRGGSGAWRFLHNVWCAREASFCCRNPGRSSGGSHRSWGSLDDAVSVRTCRRAADPMPVRAVRGFCSVAPRNYFF